MRLFSALLALFCCLPALADDTPLRPSARLIFKDPAFLHSGSCVAYREGGSGWIMTDPVFYLKGTVIGATVKNRLLKTCPLIPGKNIEQYNRAEFNERALAFPCLVEGEPAQAAQIGIVRLRVDTWETPHARRAANMGRLYRGMFINQALKQGMEIELEADLLEICNQ